MYQIRLCRCSVADIYANISASCLVDTVGLVTEIVIVGQTHGIAVIDGVVHPPPATQCCRMLPSSPVGLHNKPLSA